MSPLAQVTNESQLFRLPNDSILTSDCSSFPNFQGSGNLSTNFLHCIPDVRLPVGTLPVFVITPPAFLALSLRWKYTVSVCKSS